MHTQVCFLRIYAAPTARLNPVVISSVAQKASDVKTIGNQRAATLSRERVSHNKGRCLSGEMARQGGSLHHGL